SRRRNTRFSRDCSSDVCSSDLSCRLGVKFISTKDMHEVIVLRVRLQPAVTCSSSLVDVAHESATYSTHLTHFVSSFQPAFTIVSINCIPLTPSCTSGKSNISGVGCSPALYAATVSAKLR